MNSFLISAFFRLEKELSTFLTWLERCEAIASSPEMDISADRAKVESELQLLQASSRKCEEDKCSLLWLHYKAKAVYGPATLNKPDPV